MCRGLFDDYNHHHHCGTGRMTLATVHHGRADNLRADRSPVRDGAYAATSDCFVHRAKTPLPVPSAALINTPNQEGPGYSFHARCVSSAVTGSAGSGRAVVARRWLLTVPLRTCHPDGHMADLLTRGTGITVGAARWTGRQ